MADYQGSVPVLTANNGDVVAAIVDAAGVNKLAIDATGKIAAVVEGTVAFSNTTIDVTATDLDIRNLAFASDKVDASGSVVKISDGTDQLAVNSDGSLNVVTTSGAPVVDYGTASVLQNASSNFDYTVTSGKTFHGECVLVGARGTVKVEVGTWNGTAFTAKAVYFQQPAYNFPINIKALALLGDGTNAIRVIVTNLDKATSDVYTTIEGFEV